MSPGAFTSVLDALKSAIVDASEAVSVVSGTGTALDPWRVPLVSTTTSRLALEFATDGTTLAVHLAASTSVDTLGQHCTVLDTRIAATLARIDLSDLAAMHASLLPGVEAALSARERGVNPPRVTLAFGDGVVLRASGVGLRLNWAPNSGLAANVDAPDLQLETGALTLPIALPVIAADGSVTLPAEAWDGVEALVGYLGQLSGGFLGDVANALGWVADLPHPGGLPETIARVRLADLVANPASALASWLPELALSDVGPRALSLLADLFHGAGASRGLLLGSGHPDDPYRFALADALPNIAVWFPPQGLEPKLIAASDALQRWRPGDPGLAPAALAAGLGAEASVSAELRALIDGRDVAGGLTALAQRWVGGDGRIVPPSAAPPGVTLVRSGVAVGQMFVELDLEDLTGRVPTTTIYVGLGAAAWPNAPVDRRIDLTAAGLTPAMFAAPAAAAGDWFVALGSRTDCLLPGSTTDGTPEQAARLARVFDVIATVSNDIVVVAFAGAGHAARLASQAQPAVTDLVTLGTPLGPIALTALSTQPTADALRLLYRLLPDAPASDPDASPEDADLALGRALVSAMMELTDRADPSADLRLPAVPQDVPRVGLAVTSMIGAVSAAQVSRAITAIVAAGLAGRARGRGDAVLPPPSGVQAGLRYVLAPTSTGALVVEGSAALALFGYDRTTGVDSARHLRVQLQVGDRFGWLSATPELELRRVSVDLLVPLDGSGHGEATVTLHDARVGTTSWERLVLGTGDGAVPVLPEARILIASAVQRITADAAGTASVALAQLLTALGIVAPAGALGTDGPILN